MLFNAVKLGATEVKLNFAAVCLIVTKWFPGPYIHSKRGYLVVLYSSAPFEIF